VYNTKIAELFNEIADMLELEGEARKFEVLAYRKAAMTVGTLQEDVGDIFTKRGVAGLMELPGIGKGIADKIREYVESGKITKYQELKKRYPVDFANLTKIAGMGSKKAFKLYMELKVKDIATLKKALEQHKISKLEGFGERSEEVIAQGLERLEKSSGRMLLGTALPEAEAIRDKLLASGLVEKAIVCGSTRRMRETVGDIDILLISDKGRKVMDFVAGLPEVESIVAKGDTKISVVLKIGLNCDFRLVEKESFGAAIQYFTGNKDHNVKLREIAIKKGYKLNEYGLFDKKNVNAASGITENNIYEKLGLDFMEPEMRENRGEIELALQHKLPKIVQLDDILGDLHVHSDRTDGTDSFEDLANAEIKLGRKYLGLTDHSKSEYVTGGMGDKEFEKYFSDVDKANDKLNGRLKLLKSGEVDILKDGKLDLKDKTLDQMDYVLAAVHTSIGLDKQTMTKRVMDAISSGHVNILAHPTDRLINQREPLNLDLDAVFDAAKKNNVVMEIDSFPERLDLNDENAIKAKKFGLKFSISTDAHRTSHLQFMRYGIGVAKRAWLTKGDVINTMNTDGLLKFFKK
jgi:DNA polymerase (family 10)